MSEDAQQSGMPRDPVTMAEAIAAQHHEGFCAWVNAGFTERQALELVKALVMASILKA